MPQIQTSLLPNDPKEIFEDIEIDLDDLPPSDELMSGPPDKKLISSMNNFGLLQPIIISMREGGYIVEDGRRRVKSARFLEWGEIKARVTPQGWVSPEVIAILCNENRSTNLISDLKSLEILVKKGATLKQISEATGMPKATIQARLQLQNLDENLRILFDNGDIKPTTALIASKCSIEMQESMYRRYTDNGKLKLKDVNEIKKASSNKCVNQLNLSVFDTPNAPIVENKELDEYKDKISYLQNVASRLPPYLIGRSKDLQLLIKELGCITL